MSQTSRRERRFEAGTRKLLHLLSDGSYFKAIKRGRLGAAREEVKRVETFAMATVVSEAGH